MKNLISSLKLVYPPFSNQEGEWLSSDSDVRNTVKGSKLYMITQREELFFEFEEDERKYNNVIDSFTFQLRMGLLLSPKITLDFDFIDDGTEVFLGVGNRILKIYDLDDNVLFWMTPDSFIYDLSHNNISTSIEHEFDFSIFSRFELHYVGISKDQDSMTRLYENAHHGRLKVLSNVNNINNQSRLTDEIMILLFDISFFNINQIGMDNLNDSMYESDYISIISDAEKAFVKLMNTSHNSMKYKHYPKSKDGLYGSGLNSYLFAIEEDLTIFNNNVEFVGKVKFQDPKDALIIQESKIVLHKIDDSVWEI